MSKLTELTSLAELRVKERLISRDTLNVVDILTAADIATTARPMAEKVLTRIAELVGVRPGQLRAEDKMLDLFRVKKDELPAHTYAAWEKYGFKEGMQAFAYDLLHILDKIAGKDFSDRLGPDAVRARNDDEILDCVMALSLGGLLRSVCVR